MKKKCPFLGFLVLGLFAMLLVGHVSAAALQPTATVTEPPLSTQRQTCAAAGGTWDYSTQGCIIPETSATPTSQTLTGQQALIGGCAIIGGTYDPSANTCTYSEQVYRDTCNEGTQTVVNGADACINQLDFQTYCSQINSGQINARLDSSGQYCIMSLSQPVSSAQPEVTQTVQPEVTETVQPEVTQTVQPEVT